MDKEIKRYLTAVFIFSWGMWGIAILLTRTGAASFGAPIMLIPYMLGGLSPATCIIYFKKRYGTAEEFRNFKQNILNPRQPVYWYLLILIITFLFGFIPTLYGGSVMVNPLYMALLELPVMIIGGGLEEIGWRGFLQPALQKRFSIVISSGIISLIWTVWHLPLWFIPGSKQEKMSILYFFLINIALSYLYSAVYNRSKSIFLCIIMHAFTNGFWDVYRPDNRIFPALPVLVLSLIVFRLLVGKNIKIRADEIS